MAITSSSHSWSLVGLFGRPRFGWSEHPFSVIKMGAYKRPHFGDVKEDTYKNWLVVTGTWRHYVSIHWECHHPNWRTHIFQRGRSTTNQKRMHFYIATSKQRDLLDWNWWRKHHPGLNILATSIGTEVSATFLLLAEPPLNYKVRGYGPGFSPGISSH